MKRKMGPTVVKSDMVDPKRPISRSPLLRGSSGIWGTEQGGAPLGALQDGERAGACEG